MKFKSLKYFTSIRKIWFTVAIREIKIREIENESLFVKYTTLEKIPLIRYPICPGISSEHLGLGKDEWLFL